MELKTHDGRVVQFAWFYVLTAIAVLLQAGCWQEIHYDPALYAERSVNEASLRPQRDDADAEAAQPAAAEPTGDHIAGIDTAATEKLAMRYAAPAALDSPPADTSVEVSPNASLIESQEIPARSEDAPEEETPRSDSVPADDPPIEPTADELEAQDAFANVRELPAPESSPPGIDADLLQDPVAIKLIADEEEEEESIDRNAAEVAQAAPAEEPDAPPVVNVDDSDWMTGSDLTAVDEPVESLQDQQAADESTEAPVESSLPEPAPMETVADEPAETVADEPAETVADEPAETVADEPAETVAEETAETVADEEEDSDAEDAKPDPAAGEAFLQELLATSPDEDAKSPLEASATSAS